MPLPILAILGVIKFLGSKTNKARKSKTVVGNSFAAAIVTYLAQVGVDVSPEFVVWILAGVNIGLRYFTKKSMKDK